MTATNGADTTLKIATHDGTFHCDEVLACYMLKNHVSQFSNATITRSRDPEIIDAADIVVDVGARYDIEACRFDHHQRGFLHTFEMTGKRSRTKLSSAGLVYRHYGQEVVRSILMNADIKLSEKDLRMVYLKVYDSFMEAIDAIDNGVMMYESDKPARYESSTDLSSRVGRLNAEWYEQNPDQDENFRKAVDMAGKELSDCIVNIAKSWLPARTIVGKAMQERFKHDESGNILVMTDWAPWKDHLYTIEEEDAQAGSHKQVKYVVYKDMTGSSWRVQCVPVAKASFKPRQPLPEQWRGIRDDELSAITGIADCIFVHAAGFIGGNKNFEGAMQMVRKALDMA